MKPTAKQVLAKLKHLNISEIARAAGVSRQCVYEWQRRPNRALIPEVMIRLEHNTDGLIVFDKKAYL